MKTITMTVALVLACAGASMAQEWELGGMASYGFYRNLVASNPIGSATAGFSPGTAFGAVVGHNASGRFSGEFRYTYRDNDLELDSGGTTAKFNGVAHVIHYDLVLHPRMKRGARVQPFVAIGGGMKLYRGTGQESAYQPLQDFALLTKTQEVKPLISIGGGIKMILAPRLLLRAEMRDYLTTFPKEVIVPIPGTKVGRWLHDFVPMLGISYIF